MTPTPFTPPDPNLISDILDQSSPFSATPWNAATRRKMNGPTARAEGLGVNPDALRGAQRMTGERASILNSIPGASSELGNYEMIQYFEEDAGSDLHNVGGTEDGDEPYLGEWGYYVERGPTESGWMAMNQNSLPLGMAYNNGARDPMPFAAQYAAMTEVPTSTTNPLRPRTIAAGYDKDEQKLTVMFRDGTLYNYYQVSGGSWNNFRKAYSKGGYILAHLDHHPRGVAETGDLTPEAAEAFARVARTAQWGRGGLTGTQRENARRRSTKGYAKGNTGGTSYARNRKFI